MAETRTSILTTKKLGVFCPGCGQEFTIEIQLELGVSADNITYHMSDSGAVAGNRKATVELISWVKGARVNHDCIPSAKRGPGRPRKVDVPPEAMPEKDNAEAHRDRLRQHEMAQQAPEQSNG
jgi:hypothetical protein